MPSQQVIGSVQTAPHKEPGLQISAVNGNADRLPKTSLEPPTVDKPRQPSKTPTGLAAEPLNIAPPSAASPAAHHFLDYTIEHLRKTSTAPNYRLIIISPSTHIYWNIAAPRILVAPGLIKHEDAFIPIEPGFHRHRGHQFTFLQGECMSMDPASRTVTVELNGSQAVKRCSQITKKSSRPTSGVNGANLAAAMSNGTAGVGERTERVQTIPYHALIMATGSLAHSDLLSLHGPHLNTIGAINNFHNKVEHAKSIVVGGAGCSGVEVAGQLATFLNYKSHWPVKRPVKDAKKIILLSGGDRCLPKLQEKVGQKAEAELQRLGVDVRHQLRVKDVKEDFDLTGSTKIVLDDGSEMVADLYIACTGVGPNSAYAPDNLRDERGYIRNNPGTMRCDAAGPRVYAVGDVASYSQNYVLDVYAAVPVLMHNLLNDLLAHELKLASPYGGNQDQIDALEDEVYVQRHVDSQLCPVSRFGGVGILMDMAIPAPMVHLLKGHDYRVCKAKMVVVNGGNPYAIKTALGNKYE